MSKKKYEIQQESNDFIQNIIHKCNLVDYGKEEKRCVKCNYITWNNSKSDIEIIEDMVNSGYPIPDCSIKQH